GCADSALPAAGADLSAAFGSAPLGFDDTFSSFAASDSPGGGFRPERGRGGRRGGHRGGHGHGGPGGGFMGGFHHDFLGGPGGGGRPFDFRLGDGCSFAAGTGLVTCASTRHGLDVLRTFRFETAAGAVQPAPDSTTDKVTLHASVSGSTTRRDGVAAVVNHTSDRVVTGLAKGSTQRTVNGTSSGTETLTGTNAGGAFTATREVGDATVGLVVPVQSGRPSYPTAGTVTRTMRASLTQGGATTTRSRQEVITFDGSATASLVITQDGVTRTCTVPLPHGRPTCSS
ncbi:MAG TPA: hypothetical protein VFQ45_04965, partial [Longimicrobium sp.]|nr:hypothetical protein [Longimicrobium sp.]